MFRSLSDRAISRRSILARKGRQVSTALGAVPFLEEALQWLPDAQRSEERVTGALEGLPETSSGKKAQILLADDNADMRAYVGRLLRTRYEVEAVAEKGKRLWKRLRAPRQTWASRTS